MYNTGAIGSSYQLPKERRFVRLSNKVHELAQRNENLQFSKFAASPYRLRLKGCTWISCLIFLVTLSNVTVSPKEL